MNCKNCGKEMVVGGEFCPFCGTNQNSQSDLFAGKPNLSQTENEDTLFAKNQETASPSQNESSASLSQNPQPVNTSKNTSRPKEEDGKSGDMLFLGFILPFIGFILYLTWLEKFPLKSSSCGKGALFGIIAYVVLAFLISGIKVFSGFVVEIPMTLWQLL